MRSTDARAWGVDVHRLGYTDGYRGYRLRPTAGGAHTRHPRTHTATSGKVRSARQLLPSAADSVACSFVTRHLHGTSPVG